MLLLIVHWFSNQLRGLVFPVSDLRFGALNMWLKLLTTQEGTLPVESPYFLWSLLGAEIQG